MSEFREKFTKEGKGQKPILFIYSKEIYMSRFISDFKSVLKEYNGMFEIYYTDDAREASKYFYIGEFPEVLPFVTIIDPQDRKQVKLDMTNEEKAEGNKNKSEDISWEKSYPKKYRELIMPSRVDKDLKKLIESYLDEKSTHFYTSKK